MLITLKFQILALLARYEIAQIPFFDIKAYFEIISIFHVCMVWIEKCVTRVTDRHHEACLVMPNSDPE